MTMETHIFRRGNDARFVSQGLDLERSESHLGNSQRWPAEKMFSNFPCGTASLEVQTVPTKSTSGIYFGRAKMGQRAEKLPTDGDFHSHGLAQQLV